MIRFEQVSVRYARESRDALRAVSLTAATGALTAVVGPNGSGKSTIVRAVLQRVPISSGRVDLLGHDAARLSSADRARLVAAVVQREEPAFPIPVREAVALGRLPHLGLWRAAGADDEAAVDRALSVAGVQPFADRRIDTLSGGEWQRVRLARALAQDAPLLIMDEPTTFLDIAHEMAVFELLAALARSGRTVLVVSHQLNLVARFAHHVLLLQEGTVAAAGSVDDVMQGPVLERVYHWPIVVSRDPAVGAPTLVPLRDPRTTSTFP